MRTDPGDRLAGAAYCTSVAMKGFVLRARWVLSALLIAGAALFTIGVAAERSTNNHHDETSAAHEEGVEEEAHDEVSEAAEGTPREAAGAGHEEHEETVLGMNVESTPLVATGVLVSVAFAILVWFRRDRLLLWLVAAFAALFAVFDVAEIVHQINENRTGIAVIAAVVVVVHAAATLVAETRATSEMSRKTPFGRW
jgi:hypothetical protein